MELNEGATSPINRQNYLTRQAEIIGGVELKTPLLVIGCGAIGSNVLQQLTKLGMNNVTLYDQDHVSPENMNSQGFTPLDIGKNKAELCKQYAALFGLTYKAYSTNWQGQSFSSEIVISCADSMAVRKQLFEASLSNGAKLFIDCRMGAQKATLFCVDLRQHEQLESYRMSLFSDAEAVAASCTNKATIFCATVCAGLITNAVKAWVTTKAVTKHITVIDFITSSFD